MSLETYIHTNDLTSWVPNQCRFPGIFGCASIHFFSEDFAALIEFNFVFHYFVYTLEKIVDFTAADDLSHLCSEIAEKSGFWLSGGQGSQ